MQYFTFLGLGKKGKYEDLNTYFRDDLENRMMTPFVQEAIYNKHQSTLNEVCIFLTPKAKETTYPVFKEISTEWPVKLIDISNNCSFEEFIPLLIENIRDEEIIIDVTHSFRSIPIRLLMTMTYAEQMKKVKINHIYYGQMLDSDEGTNVVIEDILDDYNLQKVSIYLSEFNDTLTISSQNWKELTGKDKTIKNFLKSMSEFNRMIELCEFDRVINSVGNIVRWASEVEKSPEKYVLLIPLVNKILEKLAQCSEGTIREKKAALIRLLLEHRKFQIAATFADQFFREELVSALFLKGLSGRIDRFIDEHPFLRHYGDNFIYKASQYLMRCELALFGENIKDNSGFERDFDKLLRNGAVTEDQIDDLYDRFSDQDRYLISSFFNEYRNRLNHGQSINNEEGLTETINQMLDIVVKL